MAHPIIYHVDEDLFTARTQVIINPVNVRGVMGKGLAAEFKKRYPALFQQYQQDCQSGRLRIGRPTLYKKSTPWVMNFPTKDHPQDLSKLEDLQQALTYLAANYQKADITSIAFPKIGCGEGKLSWEDVGPILVRTLATMDISTHVYIQEGDAQYQLAQATPLHIGETLPLGDHPLETIKGDYEKALLVRDPRFHPPLYYVCLGGTVKAITELETWAHLLYREHHQNRSHH